MTADPNLLKQLLGAWPTGVAAITAFGKDGGPVGLTCVSIVALQRDPWVLAWTLNKTASTAPAFLSARHFAVNVLAGSQEALALQFATSGIDRFAGVRLDDAFPQAPVLAAGSAAFVCDALPPIDTGTSSWLLPGRCVGGKVSEEPCLLMHTGRFWSSDALRPTK